MSGAEPGSGKTAADPKFFPSPETFRRWLHAHHETATELWVGFHKRASGRPSLTWPQSVDEALCVGWIDGIRKSLGETSYTIRFTPRKAVSKWSAVNVRRMEELRGAGRVLAAGERAFASDGARKADYAYEQRDGATLEPAMEEDFRRDAVAWEFFQSCPPWYRRTATWWVISAKRVETRQRRLRTLIDASAQRLAIRTLQRPAKKSTPAEAE